jgi:hypothetical protein
MLAVVLLAIVVSVAVFAAVCVLAFFDVAFRDSPNRLGKTVSVWPKEYREPRPWNKKPDLCSQNANPAGSRLSKGRSTIDSVTTAYRAQLRERFAHRKRCDHGTVQ